MTQNETEGHLRPDGELTDIFRGAVRDMSNQEHGAVKAGANDALLDYLFRECDDEILDYHIQRSEYGNKAELKAAVRKRQNQPFPSDVAGDNE